MRRFITWKNIILNGYMTAVNGEVLLSIPKGRYEEAKKYVNAALHCD
jgi:hypothetical protein